jgi:hypothetical protein
LHIFLYYVDQEQSTLLSGFQEITLLVCHHKAMLMAAIAFNLKKYLKKGGRKPSSANFKPL